jgi:hypothetical protein
VLKGPHLYSGLRGLVGGPQGLLPSAKGNVELWANLLVVSWALAFMLLPRR